MFSISRTTGIYQITCANGRIYIGSSIDIEKRWQAHLAALQRGDHTNRHLQSAWNKYGEGSFFWEILEICDEDRLEVLEQFYLETHAPYQKRGFNISLDTQANMRGRKHKPESIAKMSINRSGHITTDEHRAKLSKSLKGKKQSPEHIAKRIAPLRGRKQSEEARIRTSEATKIAMNNDAIREKIAISQSKHYIVTTPDGVEIEVTNLQKFCRENGLHQSAMCEIANGRRPHYKKWLCRHAD